MWRLGRINNRTQRVSEAPMMMIKGILLQNWLPLMLFSMMLFSTLFSVLLFVTTVKMSRLQPKAATIFLIPLFSLLKLPLQCCCPQRKTKKRTGHDRLVKDLSFLKKWTLLTSSCTLLRFCASSSVCCQWWRPDTYPPLREEESRHPLLQPTVSVPKRLQLVAFKPRVFTHHKRLHVVQQPLCYPVFFTVLERSYKCAQSKH